MAKHALPINLLTISTLLCLMGLSTYGHASPELNLKDPTRPPHVIYNNNEQEGALQLFSIFSSDNKNYKAVIDKRVVQVGDDIHGHIVTSITDNQVVLQGPSGKMTLKLFPESMKQESPER